MSDGYSSGQGMPCYNGALWFVAVSARAPITPCSESADCSPDSYTAVYSVFDRNCVGLFILLRKCLFDDHLLLVLLDQPNNIRRRGCLRIHVLFILCHVTPQLPSIRLKQQLYHEDVGRTSLRTLSSYLHNHTASRTCDRNPHFCPLDLSTLIQYSGLEGNRIPAITRRIPHAVISS